VFLHPTTQIFLADAFDVGFARDLDIGTCLCDVETVEECNEAKPFEWYGQLFIDIVKNPGGSCF
jgi:hypothetical protein